MRTWTPSQCNVVSVKRVEFSGSADTAACCGLRAPTAAVLLPCYESSFTSSSLLGSRSRRRVTHSRSAHIRVTSCRRRRRCSKPSRTSSASPPTTVALTHTQLRLRENTNGARPKLNINNCVWVFFLVHSKNFIRLLQSIM